NRCRKCALGWAAALSLGLLPGSTCKIGEGTGRLESQRAFLRGTLPFYYATARGLPERHRRNDGSQSKARGTRAQNVTAPPAMALCTRRGEWGLSGHGLPFGVAGRHYHYVTAKSPP